jgi:hypothetical protein
VGSPAWKNVVQLSNSSLAHYGQNSRSCRSTQSSRRLLGAGRAGRREIRFCPTGPNEFLAAGKGFRVSFRSGDGATKAGLASVDEGRFENRKWIGGRRLNGDETDQGKYWRFDQRQINIERAVIYRYE